MSNVYICTKTFEVFRDLSDTRISAPLFECDELLAPTISILNRLGFTTESCCSGHACEYKEPRHITPVWRDNNCYICFTKDLEEMEKKGFVVPEGFQTMKSDDYFDVVEDGEAPWKLQIYKDFDLNESMFLQVLDNAKALYTWACAMAYARDKEWEATKKKMNEIKVQINMPKPSEQVVFAPNDRMFTKIKFHDNTLDEDVTVTIKDYIDFLNGVRASFKDAIGENISKMYPALKRAYEYTRQRYLVPLLNPQWHVELVEIIYTSLEEMYGDLYDQYNDPTGSAVISDKYYIYLNELIEEIDKYIMENY